MKFLLAVACQKIEMDKSSEIELSRFYIVIAIAPPPQAVNSNVIHNNLRHFMFMRSDVRSNAATKTVFSFFLSLSISIKLCKISHMCLFVYVNTKVKIILHLLLMSDLHAIADISDADADAKPSKRFFLCLDIYNKNYCFDILLLLLLLVHSIWLLLRFFL